MQKRETINHNDKYVIFFEFEDEQDQLDEIEDPLAKRETQTEQPEA